MPRAPRCRHGRLASGRWANPEQRTTRPPRRAARPRGLPDPIPWPYWPPVPGNAHDPRTRRWRRCSRCPLPPPPHARAHARRLRSARARPAARLRAPSPLLGAALACPPGPALPGRCAPGRGRQAFEPYDSSTAASYPTPFPLAAAARAPRYGGGRIRVPPPHHTLPPRPSPVPLPCRRWRGAARRGASPCPEERLAAARARPRVSRRRGPVWPAARHRRAGGCAAAPPPQGCHHE
jgi:hypothetical protein